MNCPLPLPVFVLLSSIVAQEPTPPTLETVLSAVREKEKTLQTASVEMRTRSLFPDGQAYETKGQLRLAGKTHFHSRMQMAVGENMALEAELVSTPDGVWMREKDPMQGEVFFMIQKELVAQLREAAEILESGSLVGAFDNRNDAPLGSTLLTDMGEQFDLKVSTLTLEGVRYWVLKGNAKEGEVSPEQADMPRPDQVELLVRQADGLVSRMVQFVGGKPQVTVEITKFEPNLELDLRSFRITPPGGMRFKDVREHAPAWAQIEATLRDARVKKQEDEKAAKEKADRKEDGK